MMSLAVRATTEEQMDDPALDPAVYDHVLRDLARVNRVTMAARPTLSFLDRAVAGRKSFRLLDVGFGQGDMLRRIARWAERRGTAAELVGVDLNARSAAAAAEVTSPDMGIRFETGDYRNVGGSFDCVISSLVAHHMTDVQLREFISFMETRSKRGWLINDLHRHTAARLGYPLLARALGVHRIVREDGALSIERSFRPAEWQSILGRAGVPDRAAQVVRRFPYRLCVERLF